MNLIPICVELYKATFAYETDKEDELSLKVGETVRVSNKENSDWWIAERLDNKNEVGLVPSNVSIRELELFPIKQIYKDIDISFICSFLKKFQWMKVRHNVVSDDIIESY